MQENARGLRPPFSLSSAFCATVNHLLFSAPWAKQRLGRHAGECAELKVGPAGLSFIIDPEGYLAPLADQTPAVRIFVSADALDKSASNPAGLLQNARIEGDAALAESIGFVARNLRWEAEEDLSKVVGDVLAHRMLGGIRQLFSTGKIAVERLEANVREYARYETGLLPTDNEVSGFTQSVSEIMETATQLEKRLQHLESQVSAQK